ncbi:hypothetical protein, partial [Burkholderia orbicola]|uniref:hypothetical protein n=1 Tax=Burkholderia orbicola TaxID=2978683 RepID=UPI0039A666C0
LGYALGAIFEQYVSKRVWSQLILLKVRLTVFIHLHLGATVSTFSAGCKRPLPWWDWSKIVRIYEGHSHL